MWVIWEAVKIYLKIQVGTMKNQLKGNIMLLLTAMVWGMGFVAQKAGTVLEPFTYSGIRMLIGGIVLIPVGILFCKSAGKKGKTVESGWDKKTVRRSISAGIWCGIVLCIAENLQQFGLYFQTDAGEAGFITALYILFVPIIGLFMGKKPRTVIWICVIMGAVGFYLLTMGGTSADFHLQVGELFLLCCALGFAFHIIVVDHFSADSNGIVLSCVQFFVAGVIGLICMVIFEHPQIIQILSVWKPLFYSGVISAGIGYTLQVLGQKHAEPTAATLIMSLESVFAVLFGILILGEGINGVELLGCIVIFIAVLIPQLPVRECRQRKGQ